MRATNFLSNLSRCSLGVAVAVATRELIDNTCNAYPVPRKRGSTGFSLPRPTANKIRILASSRS